jgi:uncharacterized protein
MSKVVSKIKGRVDAAEIEKVLREIVGRFHPQKVILFGSYAYGQPHEWSDLDLLAVTPDPPPRKERWKITDELERGMSLPLQIIFMNPEEFEETKDVIGGIAYPAHHWGKVLYESNA